MAFGSKDDNDKGPVSADVSEVHFEPFSWFLWDVCSVPLMTNSTQVQIFGGVFPMVFAERALNQQVTVFSLLTTPLANSVCAKLHHCLLREIWLNF